MTCGNTRAILVSVEWVEHDKRYTPIITDGVLGPDQEQAPECPICYLEIGPPGSNGVLTTRCHHSFWHVVPWSGF